MSVLLGNYITLALGNKLSYLFCQLLMWSLRPRNKNALHSDPVTFAGHWSNRGNLTRLVNCYRCFPPLCLFFWVTVKVIPRICISHPFCA